MQTTLLPITLTSKELRRLGKENSYGLPEWPEAQTGRPTRYTVAIGNAVLHLIAGGISVRRAAKTIGLEVANILDWCEKMPKFSTAYIRAREAQAECYAADMVDGLAEASEEIKTGKIDPRIASAYAQSVRNLAETKKWLCERLNDMYAAKNQANIQVSVGLMGGDGLTAALDAARQRALECYRARSLPSSPDSIPSTT